MNLKNITISVLLCIALSSIANAQVWSEDFEGDWTVDWHADYGTWEVGIPTSGPDTTHSGSQCAATILNGNYTEPVKSRLIRHTEFVVPSASENPRLRFWHWYSFSSADYGKVQIKPADSTDWIDISVSYTSTSSSVWSYSFLDLSAYADQSIQIAFYFYSVNYQGGYSDASSGWYIDDVEVITGPKVFNNPEKWESGIGDWASEKGTWEVGIPTSGPNSAYTGENCAATVLNGNYAKPVSSRLISPNYVVPSASENPRLRFWHWYSFSSADYGKVQIKPADSTDWIDISVSYTSTSSSVWSYSFLDLSAYADQSIQIAFYFYSVNYQGGYSDASSGWYIDDVEVITGPKVFNNPEKWESGIGDWASEKGTWEVGIPTSGPNSAYTGENCAATVLNGNYAKPVSSRLISPNYVVPSASENPRLRFWHWYSFSSADYGKVQIKVKGTNDWVDIPGAYYTNTSSNSWTYTYYLLSDYADSTVQIAFYFYSVNYQGGYSDASSGWYIDDVIIEGNSNLIVNAGIDKTINSGSSATLNATVSGGTQPYIFEWTPIDGLDDPTILTPVASPLDTTTYTLKVTDDNGTFRTDDGVYDTFVNFNQDDI